MAPKEGNRGPRLRFVPFFPFLFLGAVFVGGHGALTIALSLIASALLTVGISFMIARRQRRRHKRILQRYEITPERRREASERTSGQTANRFYALGFDPLDLADSIEIFVVA